MAAPAQDTAALPSAQPAQPEWLESIARQLRDEFKLPAVWVAVSSAGKVSAAVVGVRKAGDPTPATLEDKLTIASISKPMAGLWIATLVDRGKLTYHTKLLDVLPELASSCRPEHREITLGQLLTHTAGVARNARQMPPNTIRLEQYAQDRMRMARELVALPTPPERKGKFLYSNNGFTLAATMGERVAGEAYEAAAGRVFRDRLGLVSWGVGEGPANPGEKGNVPWPHKVENGVMVQMEPHLLHYHSVRPSGGAHCTITDLVRFGIIATKAGQSSDTALLTAETWQQILQPGETGSQTSYGGFVCSKGDFPVYEHSGTLEGTRSHLRVFPEWNLSFALHSNARSDAFMTRGLTLLQDALRKRRAATNPPAPCRITLTGVIVVDESWEKPVDPKASDEKLRIRVNFNIVGRKSTGDLLTTVKVGDVERRDDRYRGLKPGSHRLHFEFDMPKDKEVATIVTIDALGTAGNRTAKTARFESTLTIG